MRATHPAEIGPSPLHISSVLLRAILLQVLRPGTEAGQLITAMAGVNLTPSHLSQYVPPESSQLTKLAVEEAT